MSQLMAHLQDNQLIKTINAIQTLLSVYHQDFVHASVQTQFEIKQSKLSRRVSKHLAHHILH